MASDTGTGSANHHSGGALPIHSATRSRSRGLKRLAVAAPRSPLGQNSHQRYHDRTAALIRLTEAQALFFAALDARLQEYRAIAAPALVVAGDEDRVMAPKVQKKIATILPNSRFELIESSGHVVYLEQTDRFFELMLGLMRTKSV